MSQYATPIYSPSIKAPGVQLQRVSLAGEGSDRYSEEDLQGRLFANPGIIPTGDFDESLRDPVSACRELGTPNGTLDLMYVTPQGGIVWHLDRVRKKCRRRLK